MSEEAAWWRDPKWKDYKWPKGTIITEYLNAKGEVVMTQPCFIMVNFWEEWLGEGYLSQGRQDNITIALRTMFGDNK